MKYLPFLALFASCAFFQSHPEIENVVEEVAEDVVQIETGINIKPEVDKILKKNTVAPAKSP